MNSIRGWVTAAAVFAAAFLLWSVLASALSALLMLFTAILLAAGLAPIVGRLNGRVPFGAAVGLAFGVFVVAIVGIGIALVQPVSAELVRLVQAAPAYLSSLQDQIIAAQRSFQRNQMAQQISSVITGGSGAAVAFIAQHLLEGPQFVAAAIGDLLLIILLAVGWMLSAGELEKFVLSLMPPTLQADWKAAFTDIEARLSAYVQGVVLNGALVGVVMAAGLALLGVPYGLLLGFIAAIFQAIPMVGAVISGLIILLVVLATSGWTKMLGALAIFAVIQVVDQNVLSPIIFGQRVQLSFLMIILSTVIGGTLLGISGAFLAVPAAAVLQVIVVRIVAPAVRRANAKAPS